ncbi:bacillithiol biosynthesis deacetylase BshB2 [Paenibacillus terrigena]|uniref:bacillithiol biosynthesis deacetylase BshB2 n=1 Tax=Paenibacillus terrigena TaxID=369333 RepID=UPI0028D0FF3C|nr:bacillithiol biosynthesis deacetylase BshB2 [Paenibacillus terrigena]
MDPKQILVVLAHPDDEGIIGGTLMEHAQQGAKITYICLTLGEMGRNMGKPPFATRVSLPKIRRLELKEACQLIGIQDVREFGLHDKMVEFEDQEAVADRVREVIEEVKPDLIYTFYPGHGVHPDHDACGAITIRAVAKLPADKRPVTRCIAMTPGSYAVLGQPDFVNDVSDIVDLKIQAIGAHKTQFQLMLGNYSQETKDRHRHERLWVYRF